VVNFTPRPLYPGEKAAGTHWIRGWVDPRAGQGDVEKTLPGLQLQSLGRSAHSQSLHRLRYPGPITESYPNLINRKESNDIKLINA
jgi:hypothetical protein